MTSDELIPSLMLFILVAGLLIAVVLLFRFMRKPKHRHPMEGQRERNIGEVIDNAQNDRR